MILVSSPGKPFTYTAKNTARRQAILKDYEPEVEALYQAVEETAQAELEPPQSWDLGGSRHFVRTVVNKVLSADVSDDDDIFRKGCDRCVKCCAYKMPADTFVPSLQATWIRNSLLHALRASLNVSTRHVSNNLVYEHPTVSALACVMSRLADPQSTPAENNIQDKVVEMLSLVEQYSSAFPIHTPGSSSTKVHPGDVVLLTGTTGGFGSELLVQLVASPEVSVVYALNRKNGTSVTGRQKATFDERELDLTVLDSPKIVLLEADMHEDRLGLSDDIYDQVRSQLTSGFRRLTGLVIDSYLSHPYNSQRYVSSFRTVTESHRSSQRGRSTSTWPCRSSNLISKPCAISWTSRFCRHW